MAETWLSTNEAVAQLGVCERTLRRYATAGRIKANKVGKSVFYDLESFIANELEKAAAEDTLVTSPYVAVIYDSRKEKMVRGVPAGACRPDIIFMLPAIRIPQVDGSNIVTYPLVPICLGTNLDKRVPGGLITGEEWNGIMVQPIAERMLENGVLKVFYPQEDSINFENSYRAYSQADALELIANTYSLYDLERYALGEDRKMILAAIAAQKEEIEIQLEFNRSNIVDSTDRRRNFKGY